MSIALTHTFAVPTRPRFDSGEGLAMRLTSAVGAATRRFRSGRTSQTGFGPAASQRAERPEVVYMRFYA